MKKYTDFIFNKKKILFILFIALNIIALFGIVRIKLDTDFASFSPDVSEYQDRLDVIEDTFGELNQLIVIIEMEEVEDVDLQNLRLLQGNLEELGGITYVQGPAPNQLIIDGVNREYSSISKTALYEYYEKFGDFSPIKTSNEVSFFVFTLFINEDFDTERIHDIEDITESFTYNSYISGDAYNQLKITDYIVKILLILPPLTILVIFAVFRWQMGAIKPTLLSVLPAGIGSLWTFGIIGWIGNEVSILTAVVPIFIIVIGSADGLHFMSHYQDAKRDGETNHDALISTLRLVGIPMIVTTLTSMAGFLSLLTISTSSIEDLSIYSSVGILLAGIATWYVLPLILSNDIDVSRKKAQINKRDLAQVIKKLSGYPTLIIVFVIVVVTSLTYNNINNEFNMLMVYKDSTIVNQNADKVSEVNGGSIPIYVTYKVDDNTVSLSTLDEVKIIVDELNSIEEVNKVINPFDLLKLVYNTQAPGELPNDMVLTNIYNTLTIDPNSTIHDLISVEDNTIRLLIFPKDLTNVTLDKIEMTIDDLDMNTSVTGVQYLMKDLNTTISQMQLYSIVLALSIVFVMLILTLKSFKVALYSLLPIVITVVALYGFLGLSSIPLNITTVIIFSITIGVGIDYAVHFSSVYKYYLKETNDNKLAIEKAFNNSSRPIIANALGISLGLSILMLSPLTIHFNVSVLMWISMIVSVTLTLTLLPFIFSLGKGEKNA